MNKLTWEIREPEPTCNAPSSDRPTAMHCEFPPDHIIGQGEYAPYHMGRDQRGRWRSWLLDKPEELGLASTSKVAKYLGVSSARVRQLSKRPDFPRRLDIYGLSGALYRMPEIVAWAKVWDRESVGGRPIKKEEK